MHSDTVYTKTAKGVLETKHKSARLPRDVNQVFLCIDGRTSVGALAVKCGLSEPKIREVLENLSSGGYIKALSDQAGGDARSPKDELDLDFTTPGAIANLSAEAENRSRAEADAHARARDAARAALEAAGLDHRIVTFTEADHAFFNDTGPRFNAPAAEQAWYRVLSWFDRGDGWFDRRDD